MRLVNSVVSPLLSKSSGESYLPTSFCQWKCDLLVVLTFVKGVYIVSDIDSRRYTLQYKFNPQNVNDALTTNKHAPLPRLTGFWYTNLPC